MSSPTPSTPAGATPAMRQFFDAKRQYRDAILFFRMGDFYEMFYEDALTAARALELTLTSRAKDASGGAIPMCGVPYHAGDTYVARLVRKGFRVAICEQMEDPKKAKGVVRREVVRVVSPGTLTDASYLDAREPAFLIALGPAADGAGYGAALLDLSTGEFTTAEYLGPDARQALLDELAVLRPREVIAPAGFVEPAAMIETLRLAAVVTSVEGWTFDAEAARRALLEQMRTQSLAGFGLEGHRGGDQRRGRAGPLPARDAESRPRAHPRRLVPDRRRQPADRPDHAQEPQRHRVGGRRPQRVAAARARSQRHVDGRPDAADVAAEAAALAGADPGSAGRGRGIRLPHHRAREGPGHAEDRARHGAPGGAGGARDRGPARSGRTPAVAGGDSPRAAAGRRAARPAHRQPGRRPRRSRGSAPGPRGHAARRAAGARPRRRRDS